MNLLLNYGIKPHEADQLPRKFLLLLPQYMNIKAELKK